MQLECLLEYRRWRWRGDGGALLSWRRDGWAGEQAGRRADEVIEKHAGNTLSTLVQQKQSTRKIS